MPKADAAHIATALVVPLTEFHTFDAKDMFPHDKLWGDPLLRIGKPCLPGHLVCPPSPADKTLFSENQ